jgi:hypothetical protein
MFSAKMSDSKSRHFFSADVLELSKCTLSCRTGFDSKEKKHLGSMLRIAFLAIFAYFGNIRRLPPISADFRPFCLKYWPIFSDFHKFSPISAKQRRFSFKSIL